MPADRLTASTSPYLRMHAGDPVDWHEWGAEAFAAARERDVPIFLSSGYSACHWCHVMHDESFTDPAVASLLNESFVCVKVDRELRPDVDAEYMDYVVATTGAGGWPMSVFLTPSLVPLLAGTYFPKEALGRLPAFRDVIETVRDIWRDDRAHAEAIAQAALAFLEGQAEIKLAGAPDAVSVDEGAEAMLRDSDQSHGGFGTAPKFPQAPALLFLIAYTERVGDDEVLYQAGHAVQGMLRGGIYDQAGGGICRYATDEAWLVPHFEKMLYDNGLLLSVLARLYAVTPEDEYAHAARQTAAFLQRDLAADGGGFYAALSADAGGVEGATYTWTYDELAEVLTADEFALAERELGVTREGVWEGRTILTRAGGREEEPEAVDRVLARLLDARASHPRPDVDTKVLTAWNALAVRGLMEAGEALDDREMTGLGETALRALLNAVDGDSVPREIGGGAAPGMLADYAALAAACLTAYETLGDEAYLADARRLHAAALERFVSDGVLYMTGADTDLPVRWREQGDSPMPSGASTSVENALRLFTATGDRSYVEWAGTALQQFHVVTEYTPDLGATALLATMRYLDAVLEEQSE